MINDNLVQLSGARRVDNIGGASSYHTVRKSPVAVLRRGICSELEQNFCYLSTKEIGGASRGSGYLGTAAESSSTLDEIPNTFLRYEKHSH